MSQKVHFTGTITRLEPGGFGVVKFDHPVGPRSNSHGLISPSNGTATATTIKFPTFKPGIRVSGVAEADERQIATVTTVQIAS
jgi:hypothetical protein